MDFNQYCCEVYFKLKNRTLYLKLQIRNQIFFFIRLNRNKIFILKITGFEPAAFRLKGGHSILIELYFLLKIIKLFLATLSPLLEEIYSKYITTLVIKKIQLGFS